MSAVDATRRLDAIVREHRGWMLRLAQSYTRDPILAEDCVQDALLNVTRALDSFEGRGAIKAWLRRVVVNAALMRLRARRRSDARRADAPVEDLADSGDGVLDAGGGEARALDAIVEKELTETVRRAIDALPESQRAILRCRDLHEYSTAETAALMNISEGAAKVRLHRARAALRRSLEPYAALLLAA